MKFPAHTLVAPHTRATPKNLTVLSGTFYHEMGGTLDKANGTKLSPGGFVLLPAEMPHSMWTPGNESVVQVTGTGPFVVNSADDPSRRP